MFHAIVRSGRDALHFIAEIDPYNVQTLQQYVRGAVEDRGTAELYVEVDPAEQRHWERQTRRWLSRLARSGVTVRVESVTSQLAIPVPSNPTSHARRMPRAA